MYPVLALPYVHWIKYPKLRITKQDCHLRLSCIKEISNFSVLTCAQQSVMNLGILMVQGLINSFGTTIMAAFAAAVKIDSFAYMPVQDFGNASSTFIAQNYGAKEEKRIQEGLKGAIIAAFVFVSSFFSVLFRKRIDDDLIDGSETTIISEAFVI